MTGLLLIILLATATIYAASQLQATESWARDLCGLAWNVCDNPRSILIGAAAVILVCALILIMRRSRGR